jgi:hypothetical protein
MLVPSSVHKAFLVRLVRSGSHRRVLLRAQQELLETGISIQPQEMFVKRQTRSLGQFEVTSKDPPAHKVLLDPLSQVLSFEPTRRRELMSGRNLLAFELSRSSSKVEEELEVVLALPQLVQPLLGVPEVEEPT